MSTLDCPGCLRALACARVTGTWWPCSVCGCEITAPRRVGEHSPAVERPPPLRRFERDDWEWRPDAKRDMAALAWRPGSGAPKDCAFDDEESLSRERREDRLRVCRVQARNRLTNMLKHADGSRMGAIVVYVYGERGEVLDGRESCAATVCSAFARPIEMARYRTTLSRGGMRNRKLLDAAIEVGVGNALIGAAVAAYELDLWDHVIPAPPDSKKSVADTFAARVAARFEAAVAELRDSLQRDSMSKSIVHQRIRAWRKTVQT